MDESSGEEGLSKAMLVLVAVLSIGGLAFLGFSAHIAGRVSYDGQPVDLACCTIQPYRSAPTGYVQLMPQTTTENCGPAETERQCCQRIAQDRAGRLVGARYGNCNPPKVESPSGPLGGYAACCATELWQHSPTGYHQGESIRETEYCQAFESPNQCCLRSTRVRTEAPFKLLGARVGTCRTQSPQVSYPVWIPSN